MEDPNNRPKILVVDDTPENIIALEMLLEKLDADIITASSGKEALSSTLDHDFALILLDVMMPGMNGYEVAEHLQKKDETADIPIIFITAMSKSDAMEIKGYNRGAVDFLFKPINEIVLNSKIKVHLELHRMKRYIEKVILKPNSEKPKILIVDDHPDNLYALEKILKKVNASIVRAGSGNEALSKSLYHDFALIILDVQMPGMDGYEVAEILKSNENTENIPIIFVTAVDRDDAKEVKGYHKGAVDFIFKPFNEFILVSKVKIFLEIYAIKSGLEDLVAERTRELSRANKELKAQISRNERTAEKLAKARGYLVNVVNAISSSLISVDCTGKIFDLNREARKMTGVASREARGKTIEEVLPFYKELSEDVNRSMDSGEPVEKTRVPIHIDEEAHVMNVGVYPLTGNGTRGAVVRIDDVTERARIDEMMIQSEKMLSIGGLAAGMAHEINNPLAGIIQNIQLVKSRVAKDIPKNRRAAEECGASLDTIKAYMGKREVFQMIDSIMECGERARKIVANMLGFSQKSEGRTTRVDPCDLLDNTIELVGNDYDLKNKFDFRQIEILREYEPDIPHVSCQRSKIQQVILNILTNGAHAWA